MRVVFGRTRRARGIRFFEFSESSEFSEGAGFGVFGVLGGLGVLGVFGPGFFFLDMRKAPCGALFFSSSLIFPFYFLRRRTDLVAEEDFEAEDSLTFAGFFFERALSLERLARADLAGFFSSAFTSVESPDAAASAAALASAWARSSSRVGVQCQYAETSFSAW